MRTPRIIILVLFLVACLFVVCRAITSVRSAVASPRTPPSLTRKKSDSIFGFVYYNTPFSLFPPNAAISLTDDNSTSFAARPAAFGPKLASHGLSGPLWVGDGFPEDSRDGDGEMGCGDLPRWSGADGKGTLRSSFKAAVSRPDGVKGRNAAGTHARVGAKSRKDDSGSSLDIDSSTSDRTDDDLPTDVQMIQQEADIKGKVVLLIRGGCGFLEKVMWAQRRGALAVIVGDNQKGGPLIQMFAHGEEVENVTIPSVFTARTTAHLLSSLTQPGSFIEDSLDDQGNPILKVQQGPGRKHATRRDHAVADAKSTARRFGLPQTRSTSWIRTLLTFAWSSETARSDASSTRTKKSDSANEFVKLSKTGMVSSRKRAQASDETRKGGTTTEVHDLEAPNDGDSDLDPPKGPKDPVHEPHQGLWVTITPTSSASPFFDTLLVLVISPLVTLTVVYSLLILRARIRRRRWRAPKSVVERLPVRTYHTVAATPNATSKVPTPSSTSPTTPLLQHSPPRSRPRSRTTTGVMESENLLHSSSAIPTADSSSRNNREHEKGSGGFSAEWRKYMGRQVECVVCLEEYVDGVSKVMSLPCGHEFHADCITPWLTTRRRTCPICKGDVVRSLARGTSSGPRYEPYHDDSDDDTVAEASGSRAPEEDSDLEQGSGPSWQRSENTDSWLGLFSTHLGGGTRQDRSRAPSPESRP